PDIALDEFDGIENPVKIKEISPISRQHRIQNGNPGPMLHRQVGDGAANHACAPCNQDTGALKRREIADIPPPPPSGPGMRSCVYPEIAAFASHPIKTWKFVLSWLL